MAQWLGQFSGKTHETKVAALEDALRTAIRAWQASEESQKPEKEQAVRRLAFRVQRARLKSWQAKLARLMEPSVSPPSPTAYSSLLKKIEQAEADGGESILEEFGFRPHR